MGSLKVKNITDGVIFNIGTGFSDDLRQEIWDNYKSHIGKIVKYKFFNQGIKIAPRFPVFLGFRDIDDMDVDVVAEHIDLATE